MSKQRLTKLQKMKEANRLLRQKNKKLSEESEQLQKNANYAIDDSGDVSNVLASVRNLEGLTKSLAGLTVDLGTQTDPCKKDIMQNLNKELEKKLDKARRDIDELQDRNEVLEEYYEENCRKPNQTIILKKKNEELLDQVEMLKAELEHSEKKKEEEIEKYRKYEREIRKETLKEIQQDDGDEEDHVCFTKLCEKESGQQQEVKGKRYGKF